MKIITFFSEKGGVGKTSFAILYASWLKYQNSIDVGVADFNYRIKGIRKRELEHRIRLWEKDNSLPKPDENNAWPLVTTDFKEIAELKKEGFSFPYATWLESKIQDGGPFEGKEIVICDFPGALSSGEYTQVQYKGLINLTVIPLERDEQTVQSTVKLHSYLLKNKNTTNPHCIFINKAKLGLNNMRANYIKLADRMIKMGYPILPDMVSDTDKMQTIDKISIIRSTFDYPDYSESKSGDYGFQNLFIDITRELMKCPDIRGTQSADLSFINKYQKVDDGRQLSGTPFKEYEIK